MEKFIVALEASTPQSEQKDCAIMLRVQRDKVLLTIFAGDHQKPMTAVIGQDDAQNLNRWLCKSIGECMAL